MEPLLEDCSPANRPELKWERVPGRRVQLAVVGGSVLRGLRFGVLVRVGDELVLAAGEAGCVVVDLGGLSGMVVVFGSVGGFWGGVDKGMEFGADSEGIEVRDVEDFEFVHQWGGVCSWWEVFENSDYFLLDFDKGL